MDTKRTIEFVRVFGLPTAAVVIAGVDIVWLYQQQSFSSLDHFENRLIEFLAVVGGLVTTLAPYEVASWVGRYGWTRATYRTPPEEILRWAGFLVLLVATLKILG